MGTDEVGYVELVSSGDEGNFKQNTCISLISQICLQIFEVLVRFHLPVNILETSIQTFIQTFYSETSSFRGEIKVKSSLTRTRSTEPVLS